MTFIRGGGSEKVDSKLGLMVEDNPSSLLALSFLS